MAFIIPVRSINGNKFLKFFIAFFIFTLTKIIAIMLMIIGMAIYMQLFGVKNISVVYIMNVKNAITFFMFFSTYLIIISNWSSVIISTPSSWAFVSLLPASSPANT